MANRVICTRPYDCEIEYLESTGTQWIDTGIIGNNTCKVEIKVCITNNNLAMGIFGSRIYDSSTDVLSRSFSFYLRTEAEIQFHYASSRLYGVLESIYGDHIFILDGNKVYIDGSNVYDFNYSTFDSPSTFIIYSCHSGNSGNAIDSRCFIGLIYYCKIWNNNTLVRDYIPVRIGNTGYMYDKVSKKLYGNKGTGSFVLGNDIPNTTPTIRHVVYTRPYGNDVNNPKPKFRFVMPMPYDRRVEYLESSGIQYIYIPFTLNKGDNTYCSVYVTETELSNRNVIFLSSMGSKNNYGCVFLNRKLWSSAFADNGVSDNNIYDYNVWRNISIIYNESNNRYIFNVDNTGSVSQKPAYNNASGIYLFCRNNLLEDVAKARISSFKIKRNGNYILELIPVRKNGIGYMYDRVSGKLFGNSGTGQFILGNDIND